MVFAFILFFICYLPVDNGLHEIQVFLSRVDYFIRVREVYLLDCYKGRIVKRMVIDRCIRG